MRKFSKFFNLFEVKKRSIIGFLKSGIVLCSQEFCELLEMVESLFWYKKYKHINCLKVSINCCIWVVYWPLLNRFSGNLLNILQMLGLNRKCLPDNFGKIFRNTGELLLTFKICKVLISKKENYCNVSIPPLSLSLDVSQKRWKFSVFKT